MRGGAYGDAPLQEDISNIGGVCQPEEWINEKNIRLVLISNAFLDKLSDDLYGFYWTFDRDPLRFGWSPYGDRNGLYRVYIRQTDQPDS